MVPLLVLQTIIPKPFPDFPNKWPLVRLPWPPPCCRLLPLQQLIRLPLLISTNNNNNNNGTPITTATAIGMSSLSPPNSPHPTKRVQPATTGRPHPSPHNNEEKEESTTKNNKVFVFSPWN
jgi:hypothetical protein